MEKQWCKIITVQYNGVKTDVLAWLSDTNEAGKEVVTLQAIVDDFYQIEDIEFATRDTACDFIADFSLLTADRFVRRNAEAK